MGREGGICVIGFKGMDATAKVELVEKAKIRGV